MYKAKLVGTLVLPIFLSIYSTSTLRHSKWWRNQGPARLRSVLVFILLIHCGTDLDISDSGGCFYEGQRQILFCCCCGILF